jgi:class 3 adenylate cyclase/TolB-like protein/Tfp pilus assembly protein PilF
MANEEQGFRKLAAIMFTDIRGFSKKMGDDETVAMALLKAHDAMMNELFAKYGGRVIKSIGDSFMVDFSSAVNAVKCAIETQEILWYYNRGKSNLEKIEVRIGIHLGDVITDGSDIYGDGVNIASRIEAFTKPNRICISQDIYNQVKNKMQIQAARMGSMEFKNIAEPVEVYEVLIESIPELAEPSGPLDEVPSRKTVEATTQREAEEARLVEAAKRERTAEELRVEKERQQKVQGMYSRAEQFYVAGDFDKADAEIREIFKLVALHAGAQMLQMKIEDERFKKQEEQRLEDAESERKSYEEKEGRITNLLQEAMDYVEREEFVQALTAVQQILAIDPLRSEARRLEEQIREAERAKAELKSTEQMLAEERAREEELLEALAQPKAPSRFRVTQKTKRRRRIVIVLSVLIGIAAIVAGVFLVLPDLTRVYVPQTASVVVLPFTVSPADADTMRLGEGVANVVINDLNRYRPFSVIAPTSAYRMGTTGMPLQEIGRETNVQYALMGDIRSMDRELAIKLRLVRLRDNVVVLESNYVTDLVRLYGVRKAVVDGMIQTLELDSVGVRITQPTRNEEALSFYLRSLWYVGQHNSGRILTGVEYLKEALRQDSVFAQAYSEYGKAMLKLYMVWGEQDMSLLREADRFSRYALTLDSTLAQPYRTIGAVARYNQNFTKASEFVRWSLALQARDATGLRELGYLALTKGDLDRADTYAGYAVSLDPKNPESLLLRGIVSQFRLDYTNALLSYEAAVLLGADDSLMTVRYLAGAWVGAGQADEQVRYVQNYVNEASEDYVLLYAYGRALQQVGRILDAKPYLDKASERLEGILEVNPHDEEAHSLLALVYSRLGKFDDALKHMDRALELNPNSIRFHYRKANMFAIQNKKAEALEWLRKAVGMEFFLPEIMAPDFAFLFKDPEFQQACIPPGAQNIDVLY